MLEQNTDRAKEVGVGRAFAHEKVVVAFLGEESDSLLIESLRVVLTNFGGEDLVNIGRQRVGALGLSGHEKEVAVTALLVEVELHVGLPLVE